MDLEKSRVPLAAVFITALALRLIFSFYLNARHPDRVWDGDAKHYQSYATHLLHQRQYEDDHGDKLFRMPGYPLFLTLIYRVCGESPFSVQITQGVLGAFACALLFLIAQRLYGDPWGFFCGISASICYDTIEPSGQILSEALAIPLLALFWWIWFCWKKPASIKSIILSFVCAILCLVRPDFGLFAVVLCLGFPPFFIKNQESRIKGWIWGLVFLVTFSPWIFRNWQIFHKFIPTSANSENAMYMGLALPLERIHDIPVSKRAPLTLGELDERRFYRQELISLWKITPGLKIIRAYLINLASLFYPFLPSYDWTYILFVPLWMWALFHTKENSSLSPLWLMVGLYVFIHIFAGGPVSRYRQVLAIPLIIAATAGAMDLSARSGKRFWYLFWGWASINILVFMIAPVARDFVLTLAHLLHTHS